MLTLTHPVCHENRRVSWRRRLDREELEYFRVLGRDLASRAVMKD